MSTTEIYPTRKIFVTNYPEFKYWRNISSQGMSEVTSLTDDTRSLSLYIHIPFCLQRCSFCFFLTLKYEDLAQINRYVDTVCKEIKLGSEVHGLSRRKVKSIYFGGGTPSILGDEHLTKIVTALGASYDISDAEMTIEIEPKIVKQRKVRLLNDLGFTRISLGVQSFNDDVLELSNRNHTRAQVRDGLELMLAESNATINIDLLSGLANDTYETWSQSVQEAVDMKIHNITVYKMQTYSNTDFFKHGVRRDDIKLPTDEEEFDFMNLALDKFEEYNYKASTYFTFNLDGEYQDGHLKNIWNGGDMYPIGISSFGNLGKSCFQNTSNLNTYYEKLDKSELPVIRTYDLSHAESAIRFILLRAKLTTIHFDGFEQLFGFDLREVIRPTLSELESEDYIRINHNEIQATRKGILFGDYFGMRIAFALKEYLKLDKLLMSTEI